MPKVCSIVHFWPLLLIWPSFWQLFISDWRITKAEMSEKRMQIFVVLKFWSLLYYFGKGQRGGRSASLMIDNADWSSSSDNFDVFLVRLSLLAGEGRFKPPKAHSIFYKDSTVIEFFSCIPQNPHHSTTVTCSCRGIVWESVEIMGTFFPW